MARRKRGNTDQPIGVGLTSKQMKRRKPLSSEYLVDIDPLTDNQKRLFDSYADDKHIVAYGCAGTGKTFVAASYAAAQLFHRRTQKIIITRPNIEVGKSLGFLPGTLEEKYFPYLEPFQVAFERTLGKGLYEYALKNKQIDPKPLGFMRGATFDDCIVLVDECQNMTKVEFKMLLSRIGQNCKIVLSGDDDQLDIKNSGLEDALYRLQGIRGVEVVRFLEGDIVRSDMCKEIILAYKD